MTIKDDKEQGFLSRWSRRKLQPESEEQLEPESEAAAEVVSTEQVETSDEVDQQDLPIWQQQDADPDLKKQALNALFKQAEFNELDYLNEYDEDYTTFPKLGNVVTQEMKRMLKLAEEKTRPESDVVEDNKLLAEEDGISQQPESDEDDKLA